jgi:ATP-dependent RNA helicase SUPV3L1/SUV3
MSSVKENQMSSTEDALKQAFAETRGVSLVFSGKRRDRRVALRKSLSTSFEIAGTKLFLQDAVNFPKNAVHHASVKDPAEWLKTNMDLAAQAEERWKASSAAAIALLMDFYEPTSLNFPAAAKRVAHAVVASMKTRPRSLNWLITNIPRWESRANLFKHDDQESKIVEGALRDIRLASYKDFFKTARGLGKRKLTLFVGPTNSGKTYQALNEMAKHESGVYLAPLRLLALEGQEELAKRGKPANFLTGEERNIVPGSQFTASTIEMVNLQKIVDCALIDEVQNLADEDRGWAWTQALVGAPARHVLMTGIPDCVELVQVLSSYLGEELEIVRVERKNPLKALRHAVELDGKIDPGTAIIAFTRRDVLGIREVLEQRKVATSVIYGALSPEVRRNEAKRFREGATSVLVATDAIGMGLNLPIKTVLFYTLRKWNGKEQRLLSHRHFQQIAGRAGRYGLQEEGFVGSVHGSNTELVQEMLHRPHGSLPKKFGVRPAVEHLAAIRELFTDWPLKRLLRAFADRMSFDFDQLQPSVTDEMLMLAGALDRIQARYRGHGKAPMTLEEAYLFVCAPVDVRSDRVFGTFQSAVEKFCKGGLFLCPTLNGHRGQISARALQASEEDVKVLTLYCWLAFRFPETFADLELAEQARAKANEHITKCLRSKAIRRTCTFCNKVMDPLSRYSKCERCYRAGQRDYY